MMRWLWYFRIMTIVLFLTMGYYKFTFFSFCEQHPYVTYSKSTMNHQIQQTPPMPRWNLWWSAIDRGGDHKYVTAKMSRPLICRALRNGQICHQLWSCFCNSNLTTTIYIKHGKLVPRKLRTILHCWRPFWTENYDIINH